VVWILNNNVPIRRFIRIGQLTGEKILVISGLEIGEKLILPENINNK